MKVLLFLLFLTAQSVSFALINGEAVEIGIPVVRLTFKNDSHVCSGVFIDPYTILTAAHCVSDKQTWEGFSPELDSILDSSENKIEVRQIKNIPHPEYQSHWYGNSHDLGIIKTTEYKFKGSFPEIMKAEAKISNQGILYACGKISLDSMLRKCLKGKNNFHTLFGQFVAFGKSKNTDQPGFDVSIAPNDSGGPLIEVSQNKIVGVAWGTHLSFNSRWSLPNINYITPLTNSKNLEFIKKSMGESVEK